MEKFIHITPALMLTGNSYRYKNERGEISLLYPSRYTLNRFEIYCIDGDLFEETERYDTLEDAEERIYQLLES